MVSNPEVKFEDQDMDVQRGVSNLPLVLDHRVLKDELRMTIMAKRHARGEGKLTVEFREPERRQPTPAELERKERRREQNRRAAQRCRRKKRMNQMSVLQNYDWIVSRNQQLLQEVEVLRQDRDKLQTLLNTHLQTCTCAHTQSTPILPMAGKIKVEPVDDNLSLHVGYPSPNATCFPSPNAAPSSAGASSSMMCGQWGAQASGVCASRSFTQSAGGLPPQSVPYPSQHQAQTSSNSSSYAPSSFSQEQKRTDVVCDQNNAAYSENRGAPVFHNATAFSEVMLHRANARCSMPSGNAPACSTVAAATNTLSPCTPSSQTSNTPDIHSPRAATGCSDSSAGGFTTAIASSPASQQFVPSPASSYSHSVSDELSMLRMSRSCQFQDDMGAPLSNEGRHSISSACSDVSTASELPSDAGATHDDVRMDELAGDEVSDVSLLLAGLSSDMLLPFDDVFHDQAMASYSMQESASFLQNILPEH